MDTVLPQVQARKSQGPGLAGLLVSAVSAANTKIWKQNQECSDFRGTTVTAALIVGGAIWVANVGDSRTYLWRPGRGLIRLTQDHSVVARLVAEKVIAPEDIYTHPRRNEIYRSLGERATIEVDLVADWLRDGDILLLCSDGVWEMMRDPLIEEILSEGSSLTASQMTERFIAMALSGGGLDNIGLCVVQVHLHDVTGLSTMVGRDALFAS